MSRSNVQVTRIGFTSLDGNVKGLALVLHNISNCLFSKNTGRTVASITRTDVNKIEKDHINTVPKATWNGVTLAESNNCIVVEGNQYFPPDSIKHQYFKGSDTHTTCPWKGLASYYTIEVDGKENKDSAWYYPSPKEAARQIKDYVAFWRGVKVEL